MPIEIGIALVAMYGATITAYIGTAAFFFWRLGRVPTRQEHIELRNELKADMVQLRTDFREDMVQLRTELREDMVQLRTELREDMAQLRTDFREDMAQLRTELREDFQRSHQQILLALVNHSHRDDGQTVFTLPPEMETAPAPADD